MILRNTVACRTSVDIVKLYNTGKTAENVLGTVVPTDVIAPVQILIFWVCYEVLTMVVIITAMVHLNGR